MRASLGLLAISLISVVACTTAGGSSDPSGAASGTSPTDPADPNAPADPSSAGASAARLVADLAVTDVAVFQAVKATVVKGGSLVAASKRNAPVVANRPALARIYVKPAAGWSPREVTAELRLVGADDTALPLLRETKTISAASSDDDLNSTFNLEIPAEDLARDVTFQVALTATDGAPLPEGEESPARFPADGSFASLGVERSATLKVVVVPLRYETDGSGRTPDVSAAQLDRYKQTLMKLYPTSDVEVRARAPYAWTSTIAGNGTGFTNVLRAMHRLRQEDNVDDDVYYYGLLAPAPSFTAFCQGGCVTGLSTVTDEDTPVLRASIGVGYTGQASANTMAHEIGHAHGREHAPCGGASGVDPDYPYPQAQIGVWGYDILGQRLIPPTRGRDIMGYCPNEWVSDYTYRALFERIVSVSQVAQPKVQEAKAPAAPSSGSRFRVAEVSEENAALATPGARFVPFDHMPGGVVVVPR